MGNHKDFRDGMDLLWAGKLKPVGDRVKDLSEGERAFEMLEAGEKLGKIVLTA